MADHIEGMPPYVKVLWSDELLTAMKLRDDDCNALVVDIGKPGPDGFYSPTITVDRTDNPLDAMRKDHDEWKEAARRWREDKTEEEARLERELARAERERDAAVDWLAVAGWYALSGEHTNDDDAVLADLRARMEADGG